MHLSPRKRSSLEWGFEGQLEATVGNTKDLVGDRQCIDIQRWHRKKLLEPGKVFIQEWKNTDLSVISINVEVKQDLLVLRYGARPLGDQSKQRNDIQERVGLSFSSCNYGGRRPWFICPMPECDRRVTVLYLEGMNFICRVCASLTYECRRLDQRNRALLHTRKIRTRLGGNLTVTDPFPERPKGMHWTTYNLLKTKVEELDLKWDPAGIWRVSQ
jgi:hypothetical protein